MPVRSGEPEMPRGAALIGKSVTIKGQIVSREDLFVDGEVEGSIEVIDHRITVGPNGRVNAGLKAKEILVIGSVLGNVEAIERIEIRKDAKLVGDIKTARIVIEDGAFFKGSIDIARPEQPKAAPPKPQTPAPQPVSTPQPAPVGGGGSRS